MRRPRSCVLASSNVITGGGGGKYTEDRRKLDTMTIRNRLEKLENRAQVASVPEQTEQSKIDILWNVAASGSGSTQIQAIKTLNDMRMAEQIVEKDERSEEEVRANIEILIAEYPAMPAMG